MCIIRIIKQAFLLFVLLLVGYGALGYDKHREKCNAMVEAWSEQALHELSELPEDHQLHLKELLYFLHVPRTGGRTFHQWLIFCALNQSFCSVVTKFVSSM